MENTQTIDKITLRLEEKLAEAENAVKEHKKVIASNDAKREEFLARLKELADSYNEVFEITPYDLDRYDRGYKDTSWGKGDFYGASNLLSEIYLNVDNNKGRWRYCSGKTQYIEGDLDRKKYSIEKFVEMHRGFKLLFSAKGYLLGRPQGCGSLSGLCFNCDFHRGVRDRSFKREDFETFLNSNENWFEYSEPMVAELKNSPYQDRVSTHIVDVPYIAKDLSESEWDLYKHQNMNPDKLTLNEMLSDVYLIKSDTREISVGSEKAAFKEQPILQEQIKKKSLLERLFGK